MPVFAFSLILLTTLVSHCGTRPGGGTPPDTGGPVTTLYSVGGSVSGLGPGESVTLSNGADTVTVTEPATTFTFPTRLAKGASYDVQIVSTTSVNPCTTGFNSGTIGATNVSNVSALCTSCLNTGAKQITVNWAASRSFDVNNAPGGGHKIYYNATPGVTKTTGKVVTVANTTSTVSGVITGLSNSANCVYSIRVGGYSAINPAGGDLSLESSITVP